MCVCGFLNQLSEGFSANDSSWLDIEAYFVIQRGFLNFFSHELQIN